MFKSKSRKRKKADRQSVQPAKTTGDNALTFIGPGVVIEGTLHCHASLRIDGRVKGNIEATADVTIGKSGIVEGPIKGSQVIIAGEVRGDITVTDYLHVLSSGRLEGSTHTPRFIVEEGALFSGKSAMIEAEPKLSVAKPETTPQQGGKQQTPPPGEEPKKASI